jgi:hypothetical protein
MGAIQLTKEWGGKENPTSFADKNFAYQSTRLEALKDRSNFVRMDVCSLDQKEVRTVNSFPP